jgi:hypothetical protein
MNVIIIIILLLLLSIQIKYKYKVQSHSEREIGRVYCEAGQVCVHVIEACPTKLYYQCVVVSTYDLGTQQTWFRY